jgi:hypothetical protein
MNVNIVIIILVVLIITALFLLESEIGLTGLLKTILFIAIALGAGFTAYYFIDKKPEAVVVCKSNPIEHQPKELWGGIGLSKLCQTDSNNDDPFLRISTNHDVDVRAFHQGNEKVYGDLRNDYSGDARLAARSQMHAQKNKQAVINRSKFTVDSVKRYFEDELQANEDKAWWDNDELDAYF